MDRPLCEMVPTIEHPHLKISEVSLGSQWDFKLLAQLVGEELADEVWRKVCAGRTGEDVLIWRPES